MDEKLRQLKRYLYDALIEGSKEQSEGDVQKLYQAMALQITRAVQKEGVHVIQFQAAVGRRVTLNIVAALELIDEINDATTIPVEDNILLLPEKRKPGRKSKMPNREILIQLLEGCFWNKREAARRLKVPYSTLCDWLRRAGLKKPKTKGGDHNHKTG